MNGKKIHAQKKPPNDICISFIQNAYNNSLKLSISDFMVRWSLLIAYSCCSYALDSNNAIMIKAYFVNSVRHKRAIE